MKGSVKMEKNTSKNTNATWERASNPMTMRHSGGNMPIGTHRITEVTAEKAEPETKVDTNTKTEASKPMRKKQKILWNRVAIAVIGIALVVVGAIKGINALTSNSDSDSGIRIEPSSITENDSDSSISEAAPTDNSSIIEHPVIIDITEEDKLIVGRCLKNETCTLPSDYLSVAEKARYNELLNATNLSQNEQQELFNIEETFQYRYDLAQQLTAAAILNRIGKEGFGSKAYIEDGYKAKDLSDVLAQENQFPGILNNHFEIDSRTMQNVERVLHGDTLVEIPANLFYETSYLGNDEEGAEAGLIARMYPGTRSVHVFELIPCSYPNQDGVVEDHLQTFGINSTGNGIGSEIP